MTNTILPPLSLAVTVTVVRDREIWTALRANQIAGFVFHALLGKSKYGLLIKREVKMAGY